jgi:hypothetical protein
MTPKVFKGQNIIIDDRKIIHCFEEGDDNPLHVLSLECPCNATPFTVVDEMEGMEIDRAGHRIHRCLRHNLIMPKTVLREPSRANMQLDDNEGVYLIQDAANKISTMSMKGIFSKDTARLLHEQIDGMYDADDLKFDH